MANNSLGEKMENRSFMFYQTYYECIVALEESGETEAANTLVWEILYYGITGKRRDRLKSPFAEAAMRSIAPLIDRSVKNGEESLERIKLEDETYLKQLIVERMAADMSKD